VGRGGREVVGWKVVGLRCTLPAGPSVARPVCPKGVGVAHPSGNLRAGRFRSGLSGGGQVSLKGAAGPVDRGNGAPEGCRCGVSAGRQVRLKGGVGQAGRWTGLAEG
jgi:hypothetical protein